MFELVKKILKKLNSKESLVVVIYEAFYFNVAQGQINGVPHKIQTHS